MAREWSRSLEASRWWTVRPQGASMLHSPLSRYPREYEMKIHRVVQGEDIGSIAFEHGFLPDTLWKHKSNKNLREKRKDPYVLKEGDEVFIPELRLREEPIRTGATHDFRRKGVPATLRIQFREDGKPRAEVPYVLKIVARRGPPIPDVSSKTDKDGLLTESIPPDAIGGEIILNPGGDEEHIPLKLGCINPADDGFQGVESMLNNMGYFCGKEDDVLGKRTVAAVREFQQDKMGLGEDKLLAEDAKEIDEATLKAIVMEYSEVKA